MNFLKLAVVLLGFQAAALDNPANFNFDGVLTNSGTPMVGPVNIKFQIYNPAANCLLFEEDHSAVALDTAGAFSLKVGSGARASMGVDGGVAWKTIMANNGTVKNTSSAGCAPGYVPATNDGRLLRVTVNGSTVLSPDFQIGAVPFATTADTLQGFMPSDFVSATTPIMKAYNGAYYVGISAPALGGNLNFTWPNSYGTNTQVLTTDGAGNLTWSTPSGGGLSTSGGSMSGAIAMAGNDITAVGNISISSGKTLGLGNYSGSQESILVGTLSTPDTGKMWYNTSTNKMMYWNGSSAKAIADAGVGWTPISSDLYFNTGNVGVGTTTPTYPMHVYNSSPGAQLMVESPSRAGILLSGSGYSSTITQTSVMGYPVMQVDLGDDSLYEMTFQNYAAGVGKVGIGTDNPWALFEVHAQGATHIPFAAALHSNNPPDAPSIQLQRSRGTIASPTDIQNGDKLGSLNFHGFAAGFSSIPGAKISAVATENWTGSAHGSDMIFETAPNGSGVLQARMVISNNGNVGIGTTYPAAGLHVDGPGGLMVGPVSGGQPVQLMKVCTGMNGAALSPTPSAGASFTISCSGIAAGMVAHCSPSSAPGNGLVSWSAYTSASLINIQVTQTGTGATAFNASTPWRCVVMN